MAYAWWYSVCVGGREFHNEWRGVSLPPFPPFMWLEIEKYRAIDPDVSWIFSESVWGSERKGDCTSMRVSGSVCVTGEQKVCICAWNKTNGGCVCTFYVDSLILRGLFFEIMCWRPYLCVICRSFISSLCFIMTSTVQTSPYLLHHFASQATKSAK